MDGLLDRLTVAPIHDPALRLMLQAALTQFYAFTLVVVRLSGLMLVGPIFGQPTGSWPTCVCCSFSRWRCSLRQRYTITASYSLTSSTRITTAG